MTERGHGREASAIWCEVGFWNVICGGSFFADGS